MKILENGKLRELTEEDKLYQFILKVKEKLAEKSDETSEASE